MYTMDLIAGHLNNMSYLCIQIMFSRGQNHDKLPAMLAPRFRLLQLMLKPASPTAQKMVQSRFYKIYTNIDSSNVKLLRYSY